MASGAPVTRLAPAGSGWTLATPTGTVTADHVVLATNGYTDGLWPRLKATVAPVFSDIAATAPLPPEIAAAILPARPVLYEISARYACSEPSRKSNARAYAAEGLLASKECWAPSMSTSTVNCSSRAVRDRNVAPSLPRN